MLTNYVLRGVKAGVAAGLAFGVFVALVGNPLVEYAETYEAGGHAGGPVVPGAVTSVVGVIGGVLLGILFGAAVFGLVFYFLEPAIPGTGGTKSVLLGAAGFLTVSGVPWLVLPPQPPGVEQALPTEVRTTWYVVLMATGAVACGLSGAVFNRLRSRYGGPPAVVGALVPFVLVAVVAVVGPTNPATGAVPGRLGAVFRAVTVVGQDWLWLVLAAVPGWLGKRERNGDAVGDDRGIVDEPVDSSASG